jgi:hypothetical protein
MPVTKPSESTVATGGASEFQVKSTPVMTFPRASFAVALNWCVFPGTIVADDDSTVTLATGAGKPVPARESTAGEL